MSQMIKNLSIARGPGLIPVSGRYPGGGHGNPLQDSYLENSMYRGAWRLCGPKERDTTEQITLTFFNQLSLLFFKLLNFQIQNKIILATVGRGHVYLWLIHIVVWQKPMQHGKEIILQLKINK